MMQKIILVLSLLFVSLVGLSQSDTTQTQGEVVSGEIVIEKDKQIILPIADKIFLRTVSPNYEGQSLDLNFMVKEPNFDWPEYKTDVPFQFIDEPYPVASYQNYVKLGYGNYNSPLLEAGLFQKLGTLDTKTKLFYESFGSGPVNDDNSGNALGSVDFQAIYKKESFSIIPAIVFSNRKYRFYGNTNRVNNGFSDDNDLKVSLNELTTSVSIQGSKNDFVYQLRPQVGLASQTLDAGGDLNRESFFGLDGEFSFKIDEKFTTGLSLEGTTGSYEGGLKYDRSLININPWVSHQRENLSIQAGFVVSSGKFDDETNTGFYPDVRVDYDLSKKWAVYGLVSGGVQWNGLNDVLAQNEFLDDSLVIANPENKFIIGGGIKGSPIKDLLVELSLTNSTVAGLPFFVSSTDSSRYTITYDTDDVNVTTFKSSLTYMPTAVSKYGASLELNGYSLESLDRPWHKPAYIFKAFTSHNIQEKLIVSAFLTSMGGIRGPADVDFGVVKLPAFVDIGIGAKYLISHRASAFIDINNLLNNEYERYLGYPIRGLAFKIGAQYRF